MLGGFVPPADLVCDGFVLAPLGPEHNERDYAAWSSSIEHIHSTPGFGLSHPDPWPYPMTLAENLGDLQEHQEDFEAREGFTYTVLDPADGDVIGCVYIYPPQGELHDAAVRSWVRKTHAALDIPLWRAVSEWLASDWPFAVVAYAPRMT